MFPHFKASSMKRACFWSSKLLLWIDAIICS